MELLTRCEKLYNAISHLKTIFKLMRLKQLTRQQNKGPSDRLSYLKEG
jgi:hypothetical protein